MNKKIEKILRRSFVEYYTVNQCIGSATKRSAAGFLLVSHSLASTGLAFSNNPTNGDEGCTKWPRVILVKLKRFFYSIFGSHGAGRCFNLVGIWGQRALFNGCSQLYNSCRRRSSACKQGGSYFQAFPVHPTARQSDPRPADID